MAIFTNKKRIDKRNQPVVSQQKRSSRTSVEGDDTSGAGFSPQQPVHQNAKTQSQTQLQQSLNQSPRVVAQAKLAEALSSGRIAAESIAPVQRQQAMDDEDLLQGKFATVQKVDGLEDEDLLQGKFAAVQKMDGLEDEDLLQGKFAAVQKVDGLEDEDLLQTKSVAIQKEEGLEDEEPILTKSDPVQRQKAMDEDDLMQAKAAPVQRLENNTGLPDQLKAGVENLSGLAMDDVNVHYNSSKPAQLSALAYTQGSEIHVAPGQEKHLAHEAWHVAQQKQDRVRPTMQAKGVAINDDQGLEREADQMGQKAAQFKPDGQSSSKSDDL